jgi:hypothetical protein
VRAVIGRGRADPARLDVTFEGWLTDCPRWEARLGDVLARTRRWQITGQTRACMDKAGAQITLFAAVYL